MRHENSCKYCVSLIEHLYKHVTGHPRYITEYNIILQTSKVNCVVRGCHVGLAGSQRDNIELSLLSLNSMIKR